MCLSEVASDQACQLRWTGTIEIQTETQLVARKLKTIIINFGPHENVVYFAFKLELLFNAIVLVKTEKCERM